MSDGVETYCSRVEQWECDFNGHWNTRFYGHAFDQGAQVVAAIGGLREVDTGRASWHLRFHSELMAADPVHVRSSAIREGAHAGAILHVLTNGKHSSATAMAWPGAGGAVLPEADLQSLRLALPRGLERDGTPPDKGRVDGGFESPLGLVGGDALDSAGRLWVHSLLVFCGRGSHVHREAMGIGPAFTRETGIGCMLVEMRVDLFPGYPAAQPLRMMSRLGQVREKSFISRHSLKAYDGSPAANVEMCLLTVDTVARKAVPLPDKITSAQASW